MKIDNILDWTA